MGQCQIYCCFYKTADVYLTSELYIFLDMFRKYIFHYCIKFQRVSAFHNLIILHCVNTCLFKHTLFLFSKPEFPQSLQKCPRVLCFSIEKWQIHILRWQWPLLHRFVSIEWYFWSKCFEMRPRKISSDTTHHNPLPININLDPYTDHCCTYR